MTKVKSINEKILQNSSRYNKICMKVKVVKNFTPKKKCSTLPSMIHVKKGMVAIAFFRENDFLYVLTPNNEEGFVPRDCFKTFSKGEEESTKQQQEVYQNASEPKREIKESEENDFEEEDDDDCENRVNREHHQSKEVPFQESIFKDRSRCFDKEGARSDGFQNFTEYIMHESNLHCALKGEAKKSRKGVAEKGEGSKTEELKKYHFCQIYSDMSMDSSHSTPVIYSIMDESRAENKERDKGKNNSPDETARKENCGSRFNHYFQSVSRKRRTEKKERRNSCVAHLKKARSMDCVEHLKTSKSRSSLKLPSKFSRNCASQMKLSSGMKDQMYKLWQVFYSMIKIEKLRHKSKKLDTNRNEINAEHNRKKEESMLYEILNEIEQNAKIRKQEAMKDECEEEKGEAVKDTLSELNSNERSKEKKVNEDDECVLLDVLCKVPEIGEYLVMYDYVARESCDLTVCRGQIVSVTCKNRDPDWIWVENQKGGQGFVPLTYIKKIHHNGTSVKCINSRFEITI